MNPLDFVATTVAFQLLDDMDVDYFVLAEHRDGSGHTLEISLVLAEDEQDVRLGLTGYCLVRDCDPVHYRGIVSWTIVGEILEMQLAPAAAAALDTPSIRIALPTGSDRATAAAVGYLIDGAPRPDDFTLIAGPAAPRT
jgi:hypothetical protein